MSLIDKISPTAPPLDRIALLEEIALQYYLRQGFPQYGQVAASFTQPEKTFEVQVKLNSTDWLIAGLLILIFDSDTNKGGTYKVISVVDSEYAILELQAYDYLTTAAGQTIPAGALAYVTVGQPDFEAIFQSLLTGDDRILAVEANSTQEWFTLQMPNVNHAIDLELRLHVAVLGFPIKYLYTILNKGGEPELYVEQISIGKVSALAGVEKIGVTYAIPSGSTNKVTFTIDATDLATNRNVHTRIRVLPYYSGSETNITFPV